MLPVQRPPSREAPLDTERRAGGPADTSHASLPKLVSDTPYDAVFLDADKPGYAGYMEQLLGGSQPGAARRLLRPGALMVADNVLRWGHIPDPGLTTSYWSSEELKRRELEGLRRFNDRCAAEPRLEVVMLPVWDGVTLMRLLD